MAQVTRLVPIIRKWEGGFVNDPADSGGATNMGVTIGVWKAIGYDKDSDGDIDIEDLRKLTVEDFTNVLKVQYWDRWRADRIFNQSIANILVDWVWCSGKWGIMIPQRLMKLKEDGLVGEKTLQALNSADSQSMHANIVVERQKFIAGIVKTSIAKFEAKVKRKATEKELLKYTSKRFEQGWKNRLADFKFEA